MIGPRSSIGKLRRRAVGEVRAHAQAWTARKRPSVLYRGLHTSFRDRRVKNGVRYRYTLKALDAAGNVAEHTIMAKPGRRLLAPAAGAQLTGPPLLRWTAVRGASYYNVQLYRGKHKVLSIWPGQASLQLTFDVALPPPSLSTAAGDLPLVRLAGLRPEVRRPLWARGRHAHVRRRQGLIARLPALNG